MKRILTIAVILLATVATWAGTYSVKEIPNVHLADSTSYVSNPDGILTPSAVEAINAEIERVKQATGAEIAVVAIDDINSDDVDDFATELFESWGVGAKNSSGVLLLLVKDRKSMTTRTGYCVEGILPDIVTNKVFTESMKPEFINDDYSAGLQAGVKRYAELLTDPEAAEELKNSLLSNEDDEDLTDLFNFLCGWAIIGLLLALAIILYIKFVMLKDADKKPAKEVYDRLDRSRASILALTVGGLGVPYIAYAVLKKEMEALRNRPRQCPNCGTSMNKLDEETDNLYLTPTQDAEERIDSVDYDVWLCPNCNERDIIPYINSSKQYKECNRCHARAVNMVSDRVITAPTTRQQGVGERNYYCHACGNQTKERYTIPRKTDNTAAAAAIAGAALGSRRGGFGGGFSGGSWGGGHTGGGGSTGHW